MPGETELVAGEICVGIEIEGLARLSFTWNEAGKLNIAQLIKSTREGQEKPVKDFANTFKRTPLIRSNSFGTWKADPSKPTANRGVYAVPEEERTKMDEYGTNNPAELVSAPHPVSVEGLNFLRRSVRRIRHPSGLQSERFFTVNPELLSDKTRHETPLDHFGDGSVVTTRWLKGLGAGGYQTTIGVSVARLLAQESEEQSQVLSMLVYLDEKRRNVREIVRGTHALAEAMLGQQPEFPAAQVEGFKLALLLYLVSLSCRQLKGRGMEKDSLGINFKGYTSFTACGFPADSKPVIESGRIDEIKAQFKTVDSPWSASFKAVIVAFDFDTFGKADLSIQAMVEHGPTIANFLHDGKLFTVIEARESSAYQ